MRVAGVVVVEELAAGEYQYFENGEVRNITEPWAISIGPDGEVLVASQRRVGDAGIVIGVEAALVRGRCQRAEFSWRQNGAARQSTYYFEGGRLCELLCDGVVQPHVSGFDYFFPLMRVFTGPLLNNMRQGHSAHVLVPWIKDTSQQDMLFTADVSERSVEHVGRRQVHGGEVDLLEYNGGQYEQAANCVLAGGAWLQAYSWRMNEGSLWEVRLASPLPELACPDFTVV
ncbi:MAG: hypothetical protein ACI89D_002279 [Bermanella sp.]